jgi:hypothetical protein
MIMGFIGYFKKKSRFLSHFSFKKAAISVMVAHTGFSIRYIV